MKILFAAADDVFLHRGGPYVKIINTKKSLEKLGIDIQYFNYWNTEHEFKNCDLVHLFGSRFSVYNIAFNMAIEKVKFVVNPIFYTRHSSSVVKFISNIDKISRRYLRGFWWDYGFTREICEWANKILPNTIDEGKIIWEGMSINKNKFEVIHNGVSGEFINADPELFKKKYGLENFILTVGHMGPDRKNVLRLFKALEQIDYPAVFIGKKVNNGETAEILKIAEKKKNILILDALPNESEELASAYAACDTFVLPSKFETPGRAALEAGLAGAKIVITPFGGTKEYFKDMAHYVDPYSIQSIKKNIEASLNDEKNDSLKNYIFNNFTWEKIAVKTENVYQSVLNH
jgi:glycosyltransferase involved in cell wall biosynthesis